MVTVNVRTFSLYSIHNRDDMHCEHWINAFFPQSTQSYEVTNHISNIINRVHSIKYHEGVTRSATKPGLMIRT